MARGQAVCSRVHQQVRIITKTENIRSKEGGKYMVFIAHFQIKEIFAGTSSFPIGS